MKKLKKLLAFSGVILAVSMCFKVANGLPLALYVIFLYFLFIRDLKRLCGKYHVSEKWILTSKVVPFANIGWFYGNLIEVLQTFLFFAVLYILYFIGDIYLF